MALLLQQDHTRYHGYKQPLLHREASFPLVAEETFLALPTSCKGQAFGNEFVIAPFLSISTMLWRRQVAVPGGSPSVFRQVTEIQGQLHAQMIAKLVLKQLVFLHHRCLVPPAWPRNGCLYRLYVCNVLVPFTLVTRLFPVHVPFFPS